MIELDWEPFKDKISPYFGEHVYLPKKTPLYIWITQEYNGVLIYDHNTLRNKIRFEKDEDATMFVLRWS